MYKLYQQIHWKRLKPGLELTIFNSRCLWCSQEIVLLNKIHRRQHQRASINGLIIFNRQITLWLLGFQHRDPFPPKISTGPRSRGLVVPKLCKRTGLQILVARSPYPLFPLGIPRFPIFWRRLTHYFFPQNSYFVLYFLQKSSILNLIKPETSDFKKKSPST